MKTNYTTQFSFLSISLILLASSVIIFGNDVAYAQSAPEAVTDLNGIPINNGVELIWSAPYDNESPITGYQLVMWKTGSEIFTTFPNLSTSTSATVTDLQNGISYSFKISAINAIGKGTDSNTVTVIPNPNLPQLPPEAITDLKATRENAQVKLTWSAPFDNDNPITSYEISYWQSGFNVIKTKTVTQTNAQITGLINEVPYSFKVVAKNTAGHGPDSNIVSATPSISVTASEPSQVKGVTALPGDKKILLSWNQPSSNGSPIIGYRVTVSEKNSNIFTTYPNVGTTTKVTIDSLKNDVSYTFKIAAINAVGIGKESTIITATPLQQISLDITNLRAIPGDGKATLSWSVPQSSIDKISSYRVREYSPSLQSYTTHSILGKATTASISGLTNGLSYGFSVLAVSSTGIGPESNVVYVVPVAKPTSGNLPSVVKNLVVTPGNGKVDVSWSAVTGEKYPIQGYKVIYQKTGSSSFITFNKGSTSTSAEIKGLSNGFSYNFKVVAINEFGDGAESKTVTVIPNSKNSPITLPTWIKNNARWWSEGLISDLEYIQSIEYLINNGIIKIK